MLASDTFIHKTDMINEIIKLGTSHDITEESMNTPNIFMLSCTNKNERCEAKIIGMYSQKDNLFHIKRIDSVHTCQKNLKRELAFQFEIKKIHKALSTEKMMNDCLRIGKIVEKFYNKFKIGYLEVFKAINDIDSSLVINKFTGFDDNKENNPDALFIDENKIFDYESCRDTVISQKTEDSLTECLQYLKEEFMSMNQHVKCVVNKTSFFFKHMQMSNILRKPVEIKMYTRNEGTIIMGLLFDPSNEHIIQSCLVSDESKLRALEVFLENDNSSSKNTEGLDDNKPFYIIDFDYEMIEFLNSRKIPFFIKSRSVFQYLHESRDEDPNSLSYFNEINYGEREFLNIEKSLYLKKFCPVNLLNLSSAFYPDFEFITPYILSLPLVDCITSLIWLISDDIKTRKASINQEDYDSKFPEALIDYFEEIKDMEPKIQCKVDLENCECECGRFQENLFPCIHAYHLIKSMGKDPLLYVSNVYNKENLLKIDDIIPVINIKVHPHRSKTSLKKKRGDEEDL